MLATIKGYYENGHIILKEDPPVTDKTEVMITFLTEAIPEKNDKKTDPFIPKRKILLDAGEEPIKEKRRLGGLKGRVTIPENFNDPLEDLNEYM